MEFRYSAGEMVSSLGHIVVKVIEGAVYLESWSALQRTEFCVEERQIVERLSGAGCYGYQ